MLTTHRSDIWAKVWSFKDHGKSFDAVYHRRHPPGFRWLHESFGTNWRMTEFQSAIGRFQLRKLPLWVRLRRRNAVLLAKGLSELPGLRLLPVPTHIQHAYNNFYVFVRPEQLRPEWNRDAIMRAVNAEGVPCFSGSCPDIAGGRSFADLPNQGDRPVARELGETSLMFLVHPTLSEDDMADVVQAVVKVMRVATG